MMSEHLSQIQLAGYGGRTLDPHELLAVDRHLASCSICHDRLTRILPGASKLVVDFSFESGKEPFHLDYDQHLEPYVDGVSNDTDREIVDSHIGLCSKCADELRDLFEFKQQSVAATLGDTDVKSSPWKRWPQLPLLPNPAFATAVVITVLILGIAVLVWTTRPASRPVEQAGTRFPEGDKQIQARAKEQPPPAPTGHTTSRNSPPSNQSQENRADQPAPPREEPVITLNDAQGQVTFNQRGKIEGLQQLPPDLKESVERVLASHQLHVSPALIGWSTGSGKLRGELEKQSTLVPLEPTDIVIETDRPTFRWRALEAARHYTVTIYDNKLRLVESSGQVIGTEWTTPKPLERGVTYSWQISAVKDGKTIVSPKPPLPEARFRILDHRTATALGQLKESFGSSHLAMGVFYWKHGLMDEAEREFQALANANPNSAAAAELLESLRSVRRR